ncbi:MAG: lytic polysaccharide monooxygenase, partial [Actinomycetota bacterium]
MGPSALSTTSSAPPPWSTAPHATLYYRLYLTKTGFDVTKPLKWSDLELV